MASDHLEPYPPLFPKLTTKDILDCQFSSWYSKFSHISIKSTVMTSLPSDFFTYLQSDGVFAPKGSNGYASDDESIEEGEQEGDGDGSDVPSKTIFAFPKLDEEIRAVIREYGSVFPKLNWSSPKDAQWILSTSDFLRCMSPADVYLSLKASDFIQHDLNPSMTFEGVEDEDWKNRALDLQLSLRKWYPFERSREVRCFVREGKLIGSCQRDMVYYEFLNEKSTHTLIQSTVNNFWTEHIRQLQGVDKSYIFDLLLTRDLQRAHVVDFNPFASKTDPLLFTYEELLSAFVNSAQKSFVPEFRVIDSPSDPHANTNAPNYQHNMVPLDALALGNGRNTKDFADILAEAIQRANT
ncbi:D123-domain-containing protein [Serendipita vermifera]|nr:D123-domain-containing protein [Serendipita vermifera]